MKPQDLLDRLAAGYEYDPMYGALCNERDQLKAENAKLRELCHETWRSCPVEEDECKKCPHYLGEDGDVWCDIPIQMAELGIEVGA